MKLFFVSKIKNKTKFMQINAQNAVDDDGVAEVDAIL